MKGFGTALKAAFVALTLAVASQSATAAETVRLAVTDITGLENLQREFGKFRDLLSSKSGYEIDFYAVSSRTAAVEALKSEKVDFVLTGPAEYVVIRKKTDAYPVVGFSRPDYFSSIIVMADSGITSIDQLRGHQVAFGDVGSTSNHLAPAQILADYGLKPTDDIKSMHVARNVAWEALKRGDISAVGMNYGKFLKQRSGEKELSPGAFRVIGRGPDLPNDLLMAGTHVAPEVVERMRAAIVDNSDEMIETILVGEDNQKYLGMKFLDGVKDSDYDYVRSMYTTIGYPEYAEFVGN